MDPRSLTPAGVRIPEKLGRYRVIACLAAGGMGQVLLAVQRGAYTSNKLVVVKTVKKDATENPALTNMFVDEARIAMRLSHPNIVNTFDFVAEAGTLYLSMEFLEGHSLLHVLRKVGRAGFPLELHLWVLTKVLAALDYIHSLRDFNGTPLGIVHRDVSPSNVILTHKGEVKLVDFGIALSSQRTTVTESGKIKGKLGYISPEQCREEPVTSRSDLYAVGVMLWEAMACKRRRQGQTFNEVVNARAQDKEPKIRDVWPAAPARLVTIVERALASQPRDRYATAAEFQADLEAYLASLPAPRANDGNGLTAFLAQHLGLEIAALRRTIESRIASERSSWTLIPGLAGVGEPSDENLVTPAGNSLRSLTPQEPGAMPGSRPVRLMTPASPAGLPAPPASDAVVSLKPGLTPVQKKALVAVAGVGLAAVGIFALVRGGGGGAVSSSEQSRAGVRTGAAAPASSASVQAAPSQVLPEIVPTSPVPTVAGPGAGLRPGGRREARREHVGAAVPVRQPVAPVEAPRPASRVVSASPAVPVPAAPPAARAVATPPAARAAEPRREEQPGMDLGRPSVVRSGLSPIDEKDPFTP